MWTCEKCKEEIEDNFDSCWKCQSINKTNNTTKEYYVELENKKEEINEINDLEIKILDKLKASNIVINFIWFFLFCIFFLICSPLYEFLGGGLAGDISCTAAICGGFYLFWRNFISVPLNRFFRKKVIKKLGLDKHKSIEKVNNKFDGFNKKFD